MEKFAPRDHFWSIREVMWRSFGVVWGDFGTIWTYKKIRKKRMIKMARESMKPMADP